MLYRLILMISFVVLLCQPAYAARQYLFQWDNGSGTTMEGWNWTSPVGSTGRDGWTNDTAWTVVNSQIGAGPQTYGAAGYGADTLTRIITTDRAPSTTTGGSLYVYDSGSGSVNQPNAWIWYDGVGLGMSPRTVASSTTNRMSYYIKIKSGDYMSEGSSGTYFHVGAYLCGYKTATNNDLKECPNEGPGNQHFYHYFGYQPDIWIHTLIDNHPTHHRGGYVAGIDPSYIYPVHDDLNNIDYPFHYFEHMHQFYMEIRSEQTNPASYTLDEMYYYSTSDSSEEAEPNQNDDSITSLWVGYDPSTKYWYTGWKDESYEDETGENTGDYTNSTFIMKWSTSPITNSNFDSANSVDPDWYSDLGHTSVVNGIRRDDAWSVSVWTRFSLPEGAENNSKIYFAVKDVSKADGSTAGTAWPWTRTDGHDAPSSYIHTIDYYLSASESSSGNSPLGGNSHFNNIGTGNSSINFN